MQTTAAELSERYGGKVSGSGYMMLCPAHEDSDASLWVTDEINSKNPKGKLRFDCKAGCSYERVRAAFGISATPSSYIASQRIQIIKSATEPKDEKQGLKRKPKDLIEAENQKKNSKKQQDIWDSSIEITQGSPPWIYLVKTRKVLAADQIIPSCLRYCPALVYWDNNSNSSLGEFPALIARMDNAEGELVNIHRTYLTADGKKADLPSPKKVMSGTAQSAAIQLFDPADGKLGLAEGIETSLAASQMFNLPVWAAYSSGNLAEFKIPAGITKLFVFVDDDKAGRKAALDLSLRMPGEVILEAYLPKDGFNDFADEWLQDISDPVRRINCSPKDELDQRTKMVLESLDCDSKSHYPPMPIQLSQRWSYKSGYLNKVEKDPKDELNTYEIPVAGICWVETVNRDSNAQSWGFTFCWIDQDSNIHRRALPCRRLHEPATVLGCELAEGGLVIQHSMSKNVLAFANEYSQVVTARLRCVDSLGWDDTSEKLVFVTNNGPIFQQE